MPEPIIQGLDALVDHLDRVFGPLATVAGNDELKTTTIWGTYGIRRAVDLLLEDGDPEAGELLEFWGQIIADARAGREPAPPTVLLH
jgi:hypothetical protein